MAETYQPVAEYQSDHDLLILLTAEVKGLRVDIAEMKDNTKEQIRDHENRIRFIERYMWLAIGALGVIQIFLNYLK